MSYGDKVAAHPDKTEITERLLAGESVQGVAGWLKSKYPSHRNRWISYLTLQRFRQEHLHLKGEVLKDIKQAAHELTTERVHAQREVAMRNSPAYENAKVAIATDILKQDQLLLDIHDKIWQRIQLLENQEANYKNDAVIVEYISQMRQLMMDYHKMMIDVEKLNKKSDGPTNVQVVIQQAHEQISILKKIVLEILQELNPDLIQIFLEKMKVRMSKEIQPPQTTIVNVSTHG